MNSEQLARHGWPIERLDDAVAALANHHGFPQQLNPPQAGRTDAVQVDNDNLDQCLQYAADARGLKAQRLSVAYGEIEDMLCFAGPALFVFPHEGKAHLLALAGGNRRRVAVLAPDGRKVYAKPRDVLPLFAWKVERPYRAATDHLLTEAGLSGARKQRAQRSLLKESLANSVVQACWMLRLPDAAPITTQAAALKLGRRLGAFLLLHFVQYLLLIKAWQWIGGAALSGQITAETLLPWGLLLITQVPLAMATAWFQGWFNIGASQVLKQFLLQGALYLDLQRLKKLGAGNILARVLESDALESLVLNGGLSALLALVDLAFTAYVLSHGTQALWLSALLPLWCLFAAGLTQRYFRHCQRWTALRLQQSQQLTEKMLGHGTRLVQGDLDQEHHHEDRHLNETMTAAAAMDRISWMQNVLLTRGWLLAALTCMVPLLGGAALNPIGIAVSLGGILLGVRAFTNFNAGFNSLVQAWIAWREVRLLVAAPPAGTQLPDQRALQASPAKSNEDLVQLRDISFRHRQAQAAVLQGLNLQIKRGERIVIEGRSGAGKSTLAAILAGLLDNDGGLLLLRGFDRHSRRDQDWHRRIALVSQFHENHIFSASLAFNLLMGRAWPPQYDDLEAAREICLELGLGALLANMPAGLQQMVGDTGWQLSHGERARVCIARAVLQQPELLILDESFAALDPETLTLAYSCIEKRIATLLMISHPPALETPA